MNLYMYVPLNSTGTVYSEEVHKFIHSPHDKPILRILTSQSIERDTVVTKKKTRLVYS